MYANERDVLVTSQLEDQAVHSSRVSKQCRAILCHVVYIFLSPNLILFGYCGLSFWKPLGIKIDKYNVQNVNI